MINFIDVVEGEPDTTYHAHKDYLSSSGARQLLRMSPYKWNYLRDHPEPSKSVFDVGKAAHTLVTGTGEEFVVVAADSWRVKFAQELRAEAYRDGKTPLLTKEYEQVLAMREALENHGEAWGLVSGCDAREWSFYMDWDGVKCRTRPDLYDSQRHLVVDYKTTTDAGLEAFSKAYSPARGFGYAMQAAWYRDTLEAYTGVAHDFLFVVQEKTPPYQVAVYRTSPYDLDLAGRLNRKARNIFSLYEGLGAWSKLGEQQVQLSDWERSGIEDAKEVF